MIEMEEAPSDERAHLLVQEGTVAFNNEDFRRAIALHHKALDYMEKNSMEAAECYDQLGQEYWRVGDIDEALAFSKRALQIKQRFNPNSPSLAKTLCNLGCIFHDRRQYEKSLYLLQGALLIQNESEPDSLEVAVTCSNLGLALMQLDRIRDAIHLHQRARTIKEALAPNTITLARTYINLANLCSSLDQFGKAVKYLEKARDVIEGLPTSRSMLAKIEINLGNVMMGMGETVEAIGCYESAIHRETQVAPDSLVLADMMQELALAYQDEGMMMEAHQAQTQVNLIRRQKLPVHLEDTSATDSSVSDEDQSCGNSTTCAQC
mmetsp:Transcript_13422/g.37035  ORF Transcript_13422/g.37035 Transcript_13422/m.37035 type:complete len:321 (-) Transcript_13422:83-1045(-)